MATKTAFVTGGASGIGRAVAEMLAKRGVRVAIVDLNLSAAQCVAESLPGGQAIAVSADIANWDSQVSAFKEVLVEFGGRVDYVFGIAGIGERTWIPNDPRGTDFAKPDLAALDVDLNGALYTAALAIQQMRRQEPSIDGFRGKIALAASICGFYCVPTLPIYTAAKHGVVGFVRSFGHHLPVEQISLNAICPGVVKTSISTAAFYDMMEERKLLVPIADVVAAFEHCLDSDISGETFEIEPRSGVVVRAGLEPLDQDTAETLAVLKLRGAPLHAPAAQF